MDVFDSERPTPPTRPGRASPARGAARASRTDRPWWIVLGASVLLLLGAVSYALLAEEGSPAPPTVTASATATPSRAEEEPAPATSAALAPAPPARPRPPSAAEEPDEPEVALDEESEAVAPSPPPQVEGDRLARAEVLAGVAPLKALIARCPADAAGQGTIKLFVGASGQVATASVTGVFAGTPTAECIVAAARTASFRASRRDTTTIAYPFVLRPGSSKR